MPRLAESKAASNALRSTHKDTIKRLYLSENKTLDEVRQIMAQSYNFQATNAQYERKLRYWDFRKYLKREDWMTIDYLVSRREMDGKASDVVFDGALIPPKKVRKERSRNGQASASVDYARLNSPSAPRGVLIRTPLASPSPQLPTVVVLHPPLQSNTLEFSMTSTTLSVPRMRTPENLSIRTQEPLEGECFWGISLPFFQFETFYDSQVSRYLASHDTVVAQQCYDRSEINTSALQIVISPEDTPQPGDAVPEFIRNTILKLIAKASGNIATKTGQSLTSFMHSIMPQVSTEEIFPVVQSIKNTREESTTTRMTKLVFFLLANNFLHLDANESKAFFEWLRNAGTKFIEQLLAMRGPAFESLAEKIFQSALMAEDLRTVRATLRAGLDPNELICQTTYGSRSSPLKWACGAGNTGLVRCLIDAGADVDGSNPEEQNTSPPLETAIKERNTELVSLLLDAGAGVKWPDGSPFQPLILAAGKGENEIIELLLSAGAEVNATDSSGSTALLEAFYDHDLEDDTVLEVVEGLLDAGADVNATIADTDGGNSSYQGTTALQRAAFRGSVPITTLLLDLGAKLTEATLYYAAKSNNEELVRILLDAGADVNGEARYELTALKAAAINQNIELTKALLKRGANVDGKTGSQAWRHSMTPLQIASYNGNFELALILLKAEADVNAPFAEYFPWFDDDFDFEGSALQAASYSGSTEVVQLLLSAGAKVNAYIPREGAAPLSEAIRNKNTALAMLLLDAGANIDSGTGQMKSKTALQYAMEWGEVSVIQVLLNAGADVDALSLVTYSPTAFTAAVESGDMKLIQLLLDRGVDINNPSAKLSGRTALTAATAKGNLELVQFLLSIGADPNDSAAILAAVRRPESIDLVQILLAAHSRICKYTGKKYGCAALQRAIRKQDMDMIRILLEAGIDVNTYPAKTYDPQREKEEKFISDEETAFGTAIIEDKNKDFRLVRLLLDSGANSSSTVTKSPRQTALILAINTKNALLVRLLIQAGAEVNAPAVTGIRRTSLQAAAEIGSLELMLPLLRAGAEVNAPPAAYGGVTALQAAAIGGYVGIANALLNRGAEVNAAPALSDGRTALEGAAEHGRIDMLQLLLDAGATVTGDGQAQYDRAIEFASKNGHNAVRNLLKAHYVRKSVGLDFEIFEFGGGMDLGMSDLGIGNGQHG